MPFYNRKQEIDQIKAVLSEEPNIVHFVYGPINSGKTALLMKVFEELPENYQVFYVNFRWKDVQSVDDLVRVLFRVKRGVISDETKEFVKVFLKAGADILSRLKGIPIPENVFNLLFMGKNKVEDVFAFLEEYFEEVKASGYYPVLVVDEMQTVKEVVNAAGRSVVAGLFNFFIGMTKERHLCHCLCATSDCLFIEDVYCNARLEGRAKYILVDDLAREEAFKVYEMFGFKDKGLVWDYIMGKFGDMVILYDWKKQGYTEERALKEMLKTEAGKLRMIEGYIFENHDDAERIWGYLKNFKDSWEYYVDIKSEKRYLSFWVERNVLFYNPVEGTLRPQSRLIQRAIKDLL